MLIVNSYFVRFQISGRAMSAVLPKFGDPLFWQTSLQKISLSDDESPDLVMKNCELSSGSTFGDNQKIDIVQKCGNINHPEEGENLSGNITIVLVEFLLHEETSVVPDGNPAGSEES